MRSFDVLFTHIHQESVPRRQNITAIARPKKHDQPVANATPPKRPRTHYAQPHNPMAPQPVPRQSPLPPPPAAATAVFIAHTPQTLPAEQRDLEVMLCAESNRFVEIFTYSTVNAHTYARTDVGRRIGVRVYGEK